MGEEPGLHKWLCIDEEGRFVLCLDLHHETASYSKVEMTPGHSGRAIKLISFYSKYTESDSLTKRAMLPTQRKHTGYKKTSWTRALGTCPEVTFITDFCLAVEGVGQSLGRGPFQWLVICQLT